MERTCHDRLEPEQRPSVSTASEPVLKGNLATSTSRLVDLFSSAEHHGKH